ncbi:L,D-transpeptidase family protein [Cohnella hashimotonis]|uniref:L,D-transpeptidase family protein n=1 Tax=Cohnella hashimotonis TaxID=2826895 RepID=A0ABT6TGB8_9BACL|nr:L,D-transpeptidase family protein [Cohnella hashimotonis]MDI4645889.1 L,D-transpeptidase family protein [Cohnella hashimotonis]
MPLNTSANPALPIVKDTGLITIEVFPQRHRLLVYLDHIPYKSFPVAVGNPSTPTPVGEYIVTYKGKNWGPSFGSRWIGLNVPWGVYGIHGTNKPFSIGQHASHGCIRMRNRDVEELYEIIPVGTKVTIFGHVLGEANQELKPISEGDAGAVVQLIQNRLQSAGYYDGPCDGRFRYSTTTALKKYQRQNGLVPSGVVTKAVYEKMGLLE